MLNIAKNVLTILKKRDLKLNYPDKKPNKEETYG